VSTDIPFYNLTRVIRGGWIVIIATTLVFGLFGFIAGELAPTKYDATATVEVTSTDGVADTNMQTEQTIAQSSGVLSEALKDISGWSLSSLKDAVSVTVPKDADVLQVQVGDASGRKAAEAANAVANAYLSDRRNASDEEQQQGLKLLEAQITQFDDQIRETTSPVRKQVLESRLAALSAQYAAVRANVAEPGRVLSKATSPAAPSTPALYVWVAGGLVAGALIGFYLATVIYRVRRARARG
jgi:succinoglycan biosynthesis transport protein ExoP